LQILRWRARNARQILPARQTRAWSGRL